ncbi:MFS general substrate transporter [Thozetella sp. PMI_491]|nr:MFS general substrate transporter [Thozetella sp. PMI_491]
MKSEVDSNSDTAAEVFAYEKGVDEAVDLVAGHNDDSPLDPAEARRIRNKIDWVILPVIFAVYTMHFIDKFTITAASVLGVIQDNHLTTDQYNTLNTGYYVGYLVFAYPHSWAFQRLPAAKYFAANIVFWAIALGLQCLCSSFGGLFTLRLLLGASECCMNSGVMLLTPMFYTRTEIGQRIGWIIQCNGIASIISGFVSYGVAHWDPARKPARWQLLFIIYSGITLAIGIAFLLVFPDSPVKARFLTQDEKVKAIRRIRSNQSGTETKIWKREHVVEAVKDVKTWLFFLLSGISNLQLGYVSQYNLILQSFGFSTLQTTALTIPAGAAVIISVTTSTILLRRFPNARCWINLGYSIPAIIATVLLMTLPWDNRVGLVISFYLYTLGTAAPWAVVMGWATVTTAGHTKKLATNAIFLVGFSLGQMLNSQFWRDQYKPRNLVPWLICLATLLVDDILMLVIRYVLNKENKRRDSAQILEEQTDYGFVERVRSNGQTVRLKVDKGLLDMTDRQNLSFRYAL